jgi:hypothetical protein
MRDLATIIDDRPDEGVFRLHRDAFADPEIFELEQKFVFARSWNFLTLESQLTLPAPFELPFPGEIPFPPQVEFVPPPLDLPNTQPRDGIPPNPFPSRPECIEEWAAARKYCGDLIKKKLLGRGDYREMGKWMWDCMMGQVSEDCGGNSTGA